MAGGIYGALILLLSRPTEFRTLLQFSLYHEQNRVISDKREWPTTGWDRPSMKACWEELAVIGKSGGQSSGYDFFVRELKEDLGRVVRFFFSFPSVNPSK